MPEKEKIAYDSIEDSEFEENGIPSFNPERAQRLKDEVEGSQKPLSERFNIDPDEYPIFSQQAGNRENEDTGVMENRTLNINETLGLMVGQTAKAIAVITGEKKGIPRADHVIYLDKSARPVSWLVDEFWPDFTDALKPETTYLAIDRRPWFERVGISLVGHEEIKEPNGDMRPANGRDFWEHFEKIPEDQKKDWLARIRGLYIKDGITSEDPDEIMNTPTILDNKNLLIVDEVSRSGATLDIATGLMKRAIPELGSVNGYVFWDDNFSVTDAGIQMGSTPVWYPQDPTDWRGRGVRDIDPSWYENRYQENHSNRALAERYGAFVLGIPLTDKKEEPGELSWKLRAEMIKMHDDYEDGRILPSLPLVDNNIGDVADRVMERLEDMGVKFLPSDQALKSPDSYLSLMKQRNKKPRQF